VTLFRSSNEQSLRRNPELALGRRNVRPLASCPAPMDDGRRLLNKLLRPIVGRLAWAQIRSLRPFGAGTPLGRSQRAVNVLI
jgi:hypothetical protein